MSDRMAAAGAAAESSRPVSPPTASVLEARDFTLAVAGRPLLEHAELDVREGELLLLLGPSGAGKSLFLQLLAAVIRPGERELTASGQLLVHGKDLLAETRDSGGRRSRAVGLVFQDHALFDHLSAEDNLAFAFDHAVAVRDPAARDAAVKSLLDEFGLVDLPHVRALSGGQRQRLAVARTLAQDPEVLIYDEPTTGLDPANARRVAERIAKAHRDHRKTSIVVTHDHAALLPYADRVVLLDPRTRSFRELSRDEVAQELIACAAGAPADRARAPRPRRLLRALLLAAGDASLEIAAGIVHLVPRFPSARWGLRAFLHQLRLVAGPAALVYTALAGVILGTVATYFTFRYLPMKHYTEPLLIDEVLSGLGFLLFRVLGPALATILIAARAGAAVTADLGNRALSRQLDAVRSLGVEPARYYRTAVGYAFLVGTPLLCLLTFVIAAFVSEIVFALTHHPEQSAFFWHQHFYRLFVDAESGEVTGLWWTLAKVEVAGFGIAAIAYSMGVAEKRSGAAVSAAITRTILYATLYVLAVHAVFALLEF
jgi:ABC-type multidrug transport system ATPase subunit/ABC-type transporter Mla maintaining outer membrane lipid asymmetry permease subunit MlaE